VSECQCELSGFCTARNVALKVTHQMICRENKPRMDAILSGEPWVNPQAKKGPQRRSCNTAKRGRCDCSNLGTLLKIAIEADIGRHIACGSCKTYLLQLNKTATHDHAAIVQKLYAEIEWPPHWRTTHGDKEGQRKRINEIVSTALAAATTTCATPQPKPVRRTVSRGVGSAFTAGPGPVRFVRSSQFQQDILNLVSSNHARRSIRQA